MRPLAWAVSRTESDSQIKENKVPAHCLPASGPTATECTSTVTVCFPLPCKGSSPARRATQSRVSLWGAGVEVLVARSRGCQERRRVSQAEQPSVSHSSQKPANGPAPARPPPPAPASPTRVLATGQSRWDQPKVTTPPPPQKKVTDVSTCGFCPTPPINRYQDMKNWGK